MIDSDTLSERYKVMQIVVFPLIAFGAIVIFGTTSLMRFVDPSWFLIACGFLAIGVTMLICERTVFEGAHPLLDKLAQVFMFVGFAGTVIVMAQASTASNRTDLQCALLERDMMSAHPVRGDSSDLYQALNCRQQSFGTLIFERPASRGRHEGKRALSQRPLPSGTLH